MKMKHKGTKELQTERLILRPWKESDTEEAFANFRVMEKCGFVCEETRRQAYRLLRTGNRVDVVERGILREDYLKHKRS